jgi:hypothetical protein
MVTGSLMTGVHLCGTTCGPSTALSALQVFAVHSSLLNVIFALYRAEEPVESLWLVQGFMQVQECSWAPKPWAVQGLF